MREDLIAIAKLARPRGLRGEIVGDVLTDFPERFDDLKQGSIRRSERGNVGTRNREVLVSKESNSL
jgi:ribosomal 30S subunit maturation factor RimM